jgi:hypothetical protein
MTSSDFDPLNECVDHVSAAMPVSLGELRAYGHRELTKTARRSALQNAPSPLPEIPDFDLRQLD